MALHILYMGLTGVQISVKHALASLLLNSKPAQPVRVLNSFIMGTVSEVVPLKVIKAPQTHALVRINILTNFFMFISL